MTPLSEAERHQLAVLAAWTIRRLARPTTSPYGSVGYPAVRWTAVMAGVQQSDCARLTPELRQQLRRRWVWNRIRSRLGALGCEAYGAAWHYKPHRVFTADKHARVHDAVSLVREVRVALVRAVLVDPGTPGWMATVLDLRHLDRQLLDPAWANKHAPRLRTELPWMRPRNSGGYGLRSIDVKALMASKADA